MEREDRWKILESTYISRRPWMTARLDKVQLPDGRINPEYWVLEFPDWVNVIAITKDGEMVMVRQYRHALGITEYELCAGVMEEGETPLQAAKRELMEETGFGGGEWMEYMTICANPSNHTNLARTFLATGVERLSEQHLDDTEELTCHLLSQEEVFGMLQRGEILQALMAAPLWKYYYEKQTLNLYNTYIDMGQYWTRKGDQEDKDERTVCPWTEHVGHGDRFMPDPDQDKD